jgi:hypothetical protein
MAESSTSAVAQLNAQTAAANLSGSGSHLSTMWKHVTKKFPELRNATHYYAYDVAKASRQAVEAAYTTVQTALNPSDRISPVSPSPEVPPPQDKASVEWEAHYVPTPASTSRGLVVRHVELQRRGSSVYLIVMLEQVGFAVFEVCETGVYEIFTDLSSLSNDVIAVKVLESSVLILRHELVEAVSLLTGDVVARKELVNCANPLGLHLIGSTHVAITNQDFYQISVRRIDNLDEQTLLYADANLVTATSHTFLAFCTLPDESSGVTKYSAKAPESALQTVARNVTSFSKLLWGSTPQATAQVQPLGAVSVYDAISNETIGAFYPHNHVIAAMEFNGDGTLLATASHVGTFINVFQILREVPHGSTLYTTSVVLLARLHRGVTRADICSLAFSPLNQFLAVGSAVGTCHIFPLEKALAVRGNEATSVLSASQISAVARLRSAPCGTPVNPQLMFSSKVSDDTSAVMLTIVSAFGVVTTARCGKKGISSHYSCYLDHFKGPREREDAADALIGTTLDVHALHCNAQVELDTYERCSPLENFWFSGTEAEPPRESIVGEWDDCVEVRPTSTSRVDVSGESDDAFVVDDDVEED